MKRTIAIFFLFTFLSANTAFGEVWKLPVLVRHYWEHSKKENNICFFEFLRIHYSDRSNHPAGSTHHHEKLPFKSAILQAGQIFTIALPPTIAFSKILYRSPVIPLRSKPTLFSLKCVAGFPLAILKGKIS